MDKVYVFVSYESGDTSIGNVYLTKEDAKKAFKKFLDENDSDGFPRWKDDDSYGRSYDECINQMSCTWDGGESSYWMEETSLAKTT